MNRLLLCSCSTTHEGPWVRARGQEHGLQVTSIGKDDDVALQLNDAGTTAIILSEGFNPFPQAAKDSTRFRIMKCVEGDDSKPTTVELIEYG